MKASSPPAVPPPPIPYLPTIREAWLIPFPLLLPPQSSLPSLPFIHPTSFFQEAFQRQLLGSGLCPPSASLIFCLSHWYSAITHYLWLYILAYGDLGYKWFLGEKNHLE